MLRLLAQVKLEDVFRETQDSMNTAPASKWVLALLLGTAAIVMLLVLVNQRRKRQVMPKTLNSPSKLNREILRQLPIRPAELKQLKVLADQQDCSNPLLLILCPSIFQRAIRGRSDKTDSRILKHVAIKVGVASGRQSPAGEANT